MALLNTRQYHSFSPSTPGHGKEIPGRPVPVNTFIDPTVFIELFVGTVGIFILSVLFWKVGKFCRSLTRHRVLCDGKLTTRYARTWYGWVTAETHERNKAFIRRKFRYIREWLSWESSKRDYQWVWWDPGLEAMEERRAKRRRLKLLPEFLKSYEETPAVHIPHPRSSIECHGALVNSQESVSSEPIGQAPEIVDIAKPLPRISLNEHHFENSTASSISLEMFTPPSRAHTRSSDDRAEGSLRVDGRMVRHLLTLPTNAHALPLSINSRRGPQKRASWAEEHTPRMRRLSNLSFVQNSSHVAEFSSESSVHQNPQRSLEAPRPVFRSGNIPRKYRAWSAQMQVKATGIARPHLRDSSGPPGTPLTALLASYLSEQSACDIHQQALKEDSVVANPPFAKNSLTASHDVSPGKRRKLATSVDVDTELARFNTAPAIFRPPKKPTMLAAHTSNQLRHSWQDADTPDLHRTKLQATWGQSGMARARVEARNRYATLPNCMDGGVDGFLNDEQMSVAKLSDWEVRLMDQLNRKLGWVYNEMTPGQKPYHFALLANHWLNRETWLVIDPVSRVSMDHRRQWGDPRFSPSDNEKDHIPRVKYPPTPRKRAQIPRIDSWRAAVNKQRRVSGIRNAIRTIELYEDSGEEPPDGKIDPACWLLPKPPQGVEMSTAQKNAWYEGGAGWQEKLEDWQQVRRGYRLQKFVHEGCANRARVKEVSSKVQKGCRTVSVKLLRKETGQLQAAS